MVRHCSRHSHSRIQRGSTLIEVALAIVIVGVGAVGLMQLMAACTFQNRAASQTTSSVLLAQQIRELLVDLPLNDPTVGSTNFGDEAGETLASFDDVDDFDGQVFDPPIDASRANIAGMDGYSQAIRVDPISATNLRGAALSKTTYTGAVRVTIDIRRTNPGNDTPGTVYTLSFIRVEE